MSYPAKTVSNYFIRKAIEEKDKSLTLMKLLKLIYIAHGWTLAINDKPLITEPVQAWKYGPVIANVYHSLKHYGLNPIDKPIEDYIYGENWTVHIESYNDNFDKNSKKILDRIWESHKNITGIQLSNWSHHEDGPWYETWHTADDAQKRYYSTGIGISDNKIKKYFSGLGRENAQRRSH